MAATSAKPEAAPTGAESAEKARESYRQGNERLILDEASTAASSYQEAIRLNPNDPAGYRGLGLARAQEGNRSEAIRLLRGYLKRAPEAKDREIISNRITLLESGL